MTNRILLGVCLTLSFSLQCLLAQSLNITEKEGMQTAYSLGDIKKISFSGDQIMVLRTDGESYSYVLSEILNLNYLQVTSVQQKPVQVRESGTLYIYPNPVHDLLYIQWSTIAGEPGLVEIFSLEGKKILSREINPYTSVYQIDISNLPKGLYVCRVHLGPAIKSARFIKQ